MGDLKKNIIEGSIVNIGGNAHIGDNITQYVEETFSIASIAALINREKQDDVIMEKGYERSIIPLVIHSHENQSPDLYIQRLAFYRIGNLLNIPNHPTEYINYHFPSVYSDEQDLENKIQKNLEKSHNYRKELGKNIIDSLRNSQAGGIIFHTSISDNLPIEQQEKILLDHAKFWFKQPSYGVHKPIVAIIKLSYPVENNQNSLLIWMKKRLYPKYRLCVKLRDCIEKLNDKIVVSLNDKILKLVVLPELSNILKKDITDWFVDSDIQRCKKIQHYEVALRNTLYQAFSKSESLSMKDVTTIIHNVLNNNSK